MTLDPDAWSSLEKELLGGPPDGPGKDKENAPGAQAFEMLCPVCKRMKPLPFHDHHRIPGDDSSIIKICLECHTVLNAHPSAQGPQKEKTRTNEIVDVSVGGGKREEAEKLHDRADYASGPSTMKASRIIFPAFWNGMKSLLTEKEVVEVEYACSTIAKQAGCSFQSMRYEYLRRYARPRNCPHPEDEDPRPFEITTQGGWDFVQWRWKYLNEEPEILFGIACNVVLGKRTWGGVMPSSVNEIPEWNARKAQLEKEARAYLDELDGANKKAVEEVRKP